MMPYVLSIAAVLVVGALVWFLRVQRLRSVARERLYVADGEASVDKSFTLAPSLRRHRWIPWVAAGVMATILYFVVGLPLIYCVSLTIIVGVIGYLIEGWIASKAALKLETQLANAIDLMVASLSAGSGVMEAVESAANEAAKPLKQELGEVLGRIRLGEKPSAVFEDMAERIPLENFRLFSFTMAVHGEVGGSLAPTLATVGKSIRDRIEIGRRIRSQSTQAQASVIGVVCITYFLGLLMWRTNPANFEEFLMHPVGANFMAAAMVLQAVGLLWITRLSQMKF
ncbi:MAG: type II secretion system F family protein [Planctomycetota bacterium]|nr:type II secretion system F family protein [Planctomycetota bacterium]